MTHLATHRSRWLAAACATTAACSLLFACVPPDAKLDADKRTADRFGHPTPTARHTTLTPITAAALDKCILVIFQDDSHAHWFGSDGQGVYRYDGRTLLQFTTAHGLRGNRIRAIQQDRAGKILVSSDGGVSRFDGQAFHPLIPANANPAEGEWRLHDDDLWFAGWQDEGLIYRYDGTSLHRLAFPKTDEGETHIRTFPRSAFPSMTFSPYDVYTILKDSRGRLWFGTGNLGVCRYDGKTFAWASKRDLDFTDDDAFGVRSIVEDAQGRFWFTRTLHRFNVSSSAPADRGTTALSFTQEPGIPTDILLTPHAPTHAISSLRADNGDLWIATYDGNVWHFHNNTLTRHAIRHHDAPVTLFSIYQDKHNRLWLGTHEHGVYIFNGQSFKPFQP